MTWWYDSNSERVLGCMLSNGSQSGVGIAVLCASLKRDQCDLRHLLSDLENAGFVEALDRAKKYRVTEEGILRLMKGLSQGTSNLV